MLDGLCLVVKGDVETELIDSAHSNVILLRQVCASAGVGEHVPKSLCNPDGNEEIQREGMVERAISLTSPERRCSERRKSGI